MPTYKLTYYNMKGDAEVCRLLFAVSGTPFEDIRVTEEEFAKIKHKTKFGKLPILEIDDKMYCGALALYTYLAKEFGLYGQTNLDGLKIDEVVHQMNEFIEDGVRSLMEKDDDKREKLTKIFFDSDCPRHLGFFEKLLTKNGTGYFVGNKLSLADIVVYEFADGLDTKKLGTYDQFPCIKALVQKVRNMENIRNYEAKRPVTEF